MIKSQLVQYIKITQELGELYNLQQKQKGLKQIKTKPFQILNNTKYFQTLSCTKTISVKISDKIIIMIIIIIF